MNRIQKLFSDNWSIQRHELSSLMAIVVPGLISGNMAAVSSHLRQNKLSAKAYNPYLAQFREAADADLPENSVLVLTLYGRLY